VAKRSPFSPAQLLRGLSFHQALLTDTRRNRAFHRALAARVRPGHTVLDIGAGSGIWAVVAARLGARRVVAVEREPLLQPVIEGLARENGVSDRVEVVCADARRLDLPRVFDVVVSETIGVEAFDEGIITLMERARTRFLRPRGILVPESVALRAALAAPLDPNRLSPPLVSADSFASLARHVPRGIVPERLRILTPSRELLRVNLRAARRGRPLPLARARFRVAEGRKVGGIAVWVDIGLAPGIALQTRHGTMWTPVFLPLDPLPRGPGRLSLELDWNASRRRWRVEFVGPRGAHHVADHSPLFAWGVVRPALARTRGPGSRRGGR
jgi:protein arginine N-methyltransferase 7